MKKSLAALAALLLMTCSLSACFGRPSTSDPAHTEEAVTIPPITVPTEPDDRTPTDLTPYTSRLEALFAAAVPAPAEDFTYETLDGGVRITAYLGGESVVVVPETLGDAPVVAIGEGAFANQAALRAVSLPDSVQTIGRGAFKGCTGMTSLCTPVFGCEGAPFLGALFGAESYETNGASVPADLSTLVLTAGEEISDYAFYACRGLEAVFLPESLTAVGDFAFYGCQSLAYIATGDTALTAVGQNAFTGCAALLSLELPATVRTMGFAMLEGCGVLETLTLPFAGGYAADYVLSDEEAAAVEKGTMQAPAATAYLGYLFGAADYTFTAGYLPASLITVTLHEGCGDIPANAFFECASVREIVIPEGVTSIGRRAFYGCESLAAVTLPDSVTAVGDDAYHGCLRLASFTGGKGLTTLGVQTFMDCVSLATVTLPAGVTHLPNACFAGCISLESLTAEGVSTQGKQVFRHCDKLTGTEWMPYETAPAVTE